MTIETKQGATKWLQSHAVSYEKMTDEKMVSKNVIIKSTESGAYGIGADLLGEFNRKFKPRITYKKVK